MCSLRYIQIKFPKLFLHKMWDIFNRELIETLYFKNYGKDKQ